VALAVLPVPVAQTVPVARQVLPEVVVQVEQMVQVARQVLPEVVVRLVVQAAAAHQAVRVQVVPAEKTATQTRSLTTKQKQQPHQEILTVVI
jgi:hypothetical protein